MGDVAVAELDRFDKRIHDAAKIVATAVSARDASLPAGARAIVYVDRTGNKIPVKKRGQVSVRPSLENLNAVDKKFAAEHGRPPNSDLECAECYRLAQAMTVIDEVERLSPNVSWRRA